MKDCSGCAQQSRADLGQGGPSRSLILAHPLESLQRGRV